MGLGLQDGRGAGDLERLRDEEAAVFWLLWRGTLDAFAFNEAGRLAARTTRMYMA